MDNRLATMLSQILGGPEINEDSIQRTKERLNTQAGVPSGLGRVMAGLHEGCNPRHRKILANGAMSALKLTGIERLDGPDGQEHLVRILDATNVIVGKTLSRGGVDPNLLYVAALVDQAARWCANEGLEYFDAFIEFMIAAKADSVEHAKNCPFHPPADREHGKDSFSPAQIKAALLALMDEKRKEEAEETGDPLVDALATSLGRLFGVKPEVVSIDRLPGESDEDFLARAQAKEEELVNGGATILHRTGAPRPGGKTGFFDPQGGPLGCGEGHVIPEHELATAELPTKDEIEAERDTVAEEEREVEEQADGVK